jgi:hypothetical protein
MTDDSDTAREFQRRRKEAWNGAKRWFFVPAAGFAAFFLMGITNFKLSPPEEFVTLFILFVLTAFSLVRIIFIVRAKYRCPRCGNIPWTDSFTEQGALDLSPDTCSSCGSLLK